MTPPCSRPLGPWPLGLSMSPIWTISSQSSNRGLDALASACGLGGGPGAGMWLQEQPSPPPPSGGAKSHPQVSGLGAASEEGDQHCPRGEPARGGPQDGSRGGSSGAVAKLGWLGVKALEARPHRSVGAGLGSARGAGFGGPAGKGLAPAVPRVSGSGGPGWISPIPPPRPPPGLIFKARVGEMWQNVTLK